MQPENPRSVVVVGCGNIGFRHLQALCASAVPASILVVEPNLEAHSRIRDQFAAAASSPHQFSLSTALPESAQSFELAVVATTAAQRRDAVEALLSRHSVRTMILEKVLFQRVRDLTDVGQLLEDSDVAAFVNCGRRTFPGYEALRQAISVGSDVRITVRGNRFGLASNAVHFLDLAEYLTGSEIVHVSAAGMSPGHVPSKRQGTVEVYGTLTADLASGATLAVECRDDDPVAVEVELESDGRKTTVDELARTVSDDGGRRTFHSQNVSETTGIYEDALTSGTCGLTPYADSVRQHRQYIEALRSHLGLSNTADEPCPIS